MGKTYKDDRYREDNQDQKNYRIIKMKKIRGWRKSRKKEEDAEMRT